MALAIGLETAVKALRAHQLAVDIAAHNIANANTPGYSRQRVLLRPLGYDAPDTWGGGLLGRPGLGVDASDVHRVRDVFLDYQQRNAISQREQAKAQASVLERAELIFNDPSDEGLSVLLANFWNAWHDVVSDPESSAARTTLVHVTATLAGRIRRAYTNLVDQQTNLNLRVEALAGEINAAVEEIARLNEQIKQVQLLGQPANDLRDRRDLLLDQLAGIGNISYTEEPDGTVTLTFGNVQLVSGITARTVETYSVGGMLHIRTTDDNTAVTVTGGELRGVLDARDTDFPALIGKLETFASTLITQVNAIHATGYGLDGLTGRDFFTGTGAADIDIHPDLVADPDRIGAASAPDAPGDGTVARDLANLRFASVLGGRTFEEYYANMVAILGADVNRAKGLAKSNELLTTHLETLRQSVQGVNIDEEVANLAAAQYAYQAAARVITTIDQMLDTLINRTAI